MVVRPVQTLESWTFHRDVGIMPQVLTGDHAMSILLPCFLAFCMVAADERAPENDSIRREEMRADLFYLAGDAFRGRLTATSENDLAPEFVASRFARLGLKPVVADASFFHRYNLVMARLGTSGTLEALRYDSTGQGNRKGEMAFANEPPINTDVTVFLDADDTVVEVSRLDKPWTALAEKAATPEQKSTVDELKIGMVDKLQELTFQRPESLWSAKLTRGNVKLGLVCEYVRSKA